MSDCHWIILLCVCVCVCACIQDGETVIWLNEDDFPDDIVSTAPIADNLRTATKN